MSGLAILGSIGVALLIAALVYLWIQIGIVSSELMMYRADYQQSREHTRNCMVRTDQKLEALAEFAGAEFVNPAKQAVVLCRPIQKGP